MHLVVQLHNSGYLPVAKEVQYLCKRTQAKSPTITRTNNIYIYIYI